LMAFCFGNKSKKSFSRDASSIGLLFCRDIPIQLCLVYLVSITIYALTDNLKLE
jgi:hypothetical protein